MSRLRRTGAAPVVCRSIATPNLRAQACVLGLVNRIRLTQQRLDLARQAPFLKTAQNAEHLSVGGAAATGRRWQGVHRAADRKMDWTKPPPRGWTSMGVALWADGTGGDLLGRCGRVGDRRRPAAMAAKVAVQPAARIADAGRPPRRLREQRRHTWRTSRRESRRIHNGRTRPGAGGVVGRLHVACVAAGTLAQRAAGQRLIAIPIVSDRGVLLWRWWWRRAERPPALGQLPLSGAIGEETVVADAVEAGREHVQQRCVSSVRALCRAAPIARRNTESAGARTCSSRSQARARASSEAVRSSRNASSSRNRASRSPAAASKALRRRYSPMRC